MTRPLVLVHGLWDTPRVFHRLIQRIDQPDRPLLAPHLPHGLGVVPLRELARRLDQHILQQYGRETPIDLLGFSMGGVIGRIWLQELRGAERTDRFLQCRQPPERNPGGLGCAPPAAGWCGGHETRQRPFKTAESTGRCLGSGGVSKLFLPLGSDGVSRLDGCASARNSDGAAGVDPPTAHCSSAGFAEAGPGSGMLTQAA